MQLKRIKDLREDKDLKQKDIAKILGMAQTTYSGYETGNRNVPNEVLIQIAEFYNTSTDYILGITNTKKPYPKKIALVQLRTSASLKEFCF